MLKKKTDPVSSYKFWFKSINNFINNFIQRMLYSHSYWHYNS